MTLRTLLLAFAVLLAQQGTLWHALEHAAHEANIAVLDHEIEKCVAYDALGHAADGNKLLALETSVPTQEKLSFASVTAPPARVVFDSRAPPYSA